MGILTKGHYVVRPARDARDRDACLALRAAAFPADARGPDAHDRLCTQIAIEDRRSGDTLGTFRVLRIASGRDICRSYSARHYDLAALSAHAGPMMEIGRFCLHPGAASDPDLLRVAWGALTRMVDRDGIAMLFGCASFPGVDPVPLSDTFAYLGRHHAAPAPWRPAPRAPLRVAFDADRSHDAARARAALPPLLRTYIAMGGWVSDHAVIDRDMGTMHVFTGVEIATIPPTRARLLRAIAQEGPVARPADVPAR